MLIGKLKTKMIGKKVCIIVCSIFVLYVTVHMVYLVQPFSQSDSYSEYTKMHKQMPPNLIGKKLPFHQVYESREVRLLKRNTLPVTDSKMKVILVWTPWNSLRNTVNYYFLHPGSDSFKNYDCPVSNCFITHDRKRLQEADSIIFHLIDTNMRDLPSTREYRQSWIVYNMEGPWLIQRHTPNMQLLNNNFNLTMGYREDSDIVVKYGYIAQNNMTRPQSHWDEVYERKVHNVVWFVSDCKTDSRREEYVKELKNYIDVDVYGLCGDKKCFPSQSDTCYKKVLKKYKFYLSFENSICKDYITEKFFNAYNYDIVAVVFGGANYSEIIPLDTYIDAGKFPKPKDLANVLKNTGNNKLIYQNYLKRKSLYKAYLHPWMCNLCERLNEIPKYSVLSDVRKWWIEDSNCKRWTKSTGYTELN